MLRDSARVPAPQFFVRQKPRHGAREIGVEHDRIRPVDSGAGADAGRAPPIEKNFLDRLIEIEFPLPSAAPPGRGRS